VASIVSGKSCLALNELPNLHYYRCAPRAVALSLRQTAISSTRANCSACGHGTDSTLRVSIIEENDFKDEE